MIKEFKRNNGFLSNFHECLIKFEGMFYSSAEAAYQASKTLDFDIRDDFTYMTSKEAKEKAKNLRVRNDWDDVKVDNMRKILMDKFTRHKNLRNELVKTKDQILIEGNNWHDNFWGDCFCKKCKDIKGKNMLGKLLMEVREEVKDKRIKWRKDL